MPSAFYVCCIYSSVLQARFSHGIKQYEPRSDCSQWRSLIWVHIVCNTCYWEQSDLGPYRLQYMLPKSISGREEQTIKVVNEPLSLSLFLSLSLSLSLSLLFSFHSNLFILVLVLSIYLPNCYMTLIPEHIDFQDFKFVYFHKK